ncbi:MAG TPA: hypothetical protein VH092_10090 [Urbifossiella sp.]|jgi:hypothetical protein|nr:hypothetical protein [Urbifossiella sp.]
MTRLVRPAVGLVLAAAVAAAAPTRAAEPDRLLPPDADVVVSVNVRQVLESDIVKRYALENLKQTLQGNDAQALLRDLGLDPLKDVDRVVIGLSGKDETDFKYLVVVHGTFDPEKLYKAAEAQTRKDANHFAMVKDGSDVMFKYTPDDGNPLYGTVVDDKTVVLSGDKKGITTALAVPPKGKAALDRQLSSLIGKMDDKATVWVAGLANGRLDKAKLKGPAANPGVQSLVGNLQTGTLVVRVEKDVNLLIGLGMKDVFTAEDANKTVGELLQTVKGALPFLAANDPKLKALIEPSKSLKSEVKDQTVVITGKLSGDAIGKLIAPGNE